jgi:hypothetical protein
MLYLAMMRQCAPQDGVQEVREEAGKGKQIKHANAYKRRIFVI